MKHDDSGATLSHYVLYFHALAVKKISKNKSVLLRNVLDKTVKITHFIESQPLSALF